MQAEAKIDELHFPVPDLSEGCNDFVETLQDRVSEFSKQHPSKFLFLTPTIVLRCSNLNREFLNRCQSEDKQWRRNVVSIVGPSAATRPQSFGLVLRRHFDSQSSWKKERWYQWTMTCRGNMFAPGAGVYPDDRWREVLLLMRSSESADGDAFTALARSFTVLYAAVERGIEPSEYRGRLQRLATRVKSAAERHHRTQQSVRLVTMFRELVQIHADASQILEVKQSMPGLCEEAQRMWKRLDVSDDKFYELQEFRAQATLNGIPLQNCLRTTTGLNIVAERYALPVTTTDSGFTIIPMDSVDLVLAVAREKNHEINELRTSR
jgi:hypothetical protein